MHVIVTAAGRSRRSASSSGSRRFADVARGRGRRGRAARAPSRSWSWSCSRPAGRHRRPLAGAGAGRGRARGAAGVDVAAVLVVPRAAGRHPARSPRSTGPGWPAGPSGVLAGDEPRAGREGPGHRGQRHARRADWPARCSPAATTSRCCSGGRPVWPAARCSATSPTPTPSRPAVGGQRRRRPPGRQGQRRPAPGATSSGPTSSGTRQRGRRGCRGAGVEPPGPRLVPVGRARRQRRWSGPAPGRPTRSAPAGHYARSKAMAERLALAADGDRPGGAWPSARTWSGGRATPSSIGRIVERARAGRLP